MALGATRRRSWLGGYVHWSKDGKPTFVIRRRAGNGIRYCVSTRCSTESAALAELARFEKDPAGYQPGGGAERPIFLDVELAKGFLLWSRDERKNTPDWIAKQRTYLAWWATALRGVDLRRVSIDRQVLAALDKDPTARQHRIAVLKTLYTWLREVRHRISAAEDPTFGTLKVPQSRPAQWKREKALSPRTYFKVRKHLAGGPWRDAVTVLAGTGWHVTELERFIRGGHAIVRSGEGDAAGVLVSPQRKSGEPMRTPVTAEALAAGRRLRARGTFSRKWFYEALQAACEAAKVRPFGPGVFRHTVATVAVNSGASLDKVSTFLGHKSRATTKKFYATHATPAKVPTLS